MLFGQATNATHLTQRRTPSCKAMVELQSCCWCCFSSLQLRTVLSQQMSLLQISWPVSSNRGMGLVLVCHLSPIMDPLSQHQQVMPWQMHLLAPPQVGGRVDGSVAHAASIRCSSCAVAVRLQAVMGRDTTHAMHAIGGMRSGTTASYHALVTPQIKCCACMPYAFAQLHVPRMN